MSKTTKRGTLFAFAFTADSGKKRHTGKDDDDGVVEVESERAEGEDHNRGVEVRRWRHSHR